MFATSPSGINDVVFSDIFERQGEQKLSDISCSKMTDVKSKPNSSDVVIGKLSSAELKSIRSCSRIITNNQ